MGWLRLGRAPGAGSAQRSSGPSRRYGWGSVLVGGPPGGAPGAPVGGNDELARLVRGKGHFQPGKWLPPRQASKGGLEGWTGAWGGGL